MLSSSPAMGDPDVYKRQDRYRGRGIHSGESAGESGDVLKSGQAPSLTIPSERIQRARHFVKGVCPPTAGVKGQTSWSRAGQRLVKGRNVGGQPRRIRVHAIYREAIQAEVVNQQVTVCLLYTSRCV